METETIKCKWCNKKGLYSFGWLDSKSEWHDKHLTCKSHAQISVGQQNLQCQLEQMRERSMIFGRERPILYDLKSA